MGTWRYTMADNICVYDENAQRLYGLTEARFLHDKDGVEAKFHPADRDLMWARVAKALDPKGDGRYDVEYRVKQLDGSWRWLSAWGLVEFEGQGAERKPVAIAGASRDLSERKQAEELQRLLGNELNHRVKNTLATVQSIVNQTLRGAADTEVARTTLNARIVALAGAHDLLTDRSWAGADLADLVARAVAPFVIRSDRARWSFRGRFAKPGAGALAGAARTRHERGEVWSALASRRPGRTPLASAGRPAQSELAGERRPAVLFRRPAKGSAAASSNMR